ncbi:hypothetical protein ES703_11331 [subsurface metagenome]
MPCYLITKIDPKLHRDFKAACAYYKITMKDTLIRHMESIVEDYLRARAMSGKPEIYTKKGGKEI